MAARRASRRRLLASVVLFGIGVILFLLAAFLYAKGLQWANEFSGVAGLFVAVAALLSPLAVRMVVWLRQGAVVPASVSLSQAADELAESLDLQWAEQEGIRKVNNPWPMPVRWQVPGKARASMLGVSWRDVGSQDKPVNPSVLKGSFEDIQELFFAGRLPSRRLVVLGQAGAGKSMLAIRLARNLLSGRRAGDRVPIVVTVATWQPRTETLLDFASGQLIRDHPGLGSVVSATDGQQPTIAFGLAATGKLMLILDGLDEIPATLRADALRRISDLGSDAPLVVTSRTAEYELAVEELGRGLPRAAVVEVLPLTPGEIKKYLTEATAPPASRWKPVFDHLAQHRTSDLAKVMQTPLMIWLARTIYATRDSTPGEIVPLAVSGGPAAIENHLMSKLVSAAFTPGEYSTAAAIRWNAESAEGWLRFIAQHLKQEETPDFAWWDLNRCAPRIVHGIVGGVPIAIPIALVVGVVAGITKNPLAGLIDGVVAGEASGSWRGSPVA